MSVEGTSHFLYIYRPNKRQPTAVIPIATPALLLYRDAPSFVLSPLAVVEAAGWSEVFDTLAQSMTTSPVGEASDDLMIALVTVAVYWPPVDISTSASVMFPVQMLRYVVVNGSSQLVAEDKD
ncbi:hypothetical protein V2G26_017136 [Clonostachys chloroleuca]